VPSGESGRSKEVCKEERKVGGKKNKKELNPPEFLL
jgi:hypothetical protein